MSEEEHPNPFTVFAYGAAVAMIVFCLGATAYALGWIQ